MKPQHSSRRRVVWAVLGFLLGYASLYCLFLFDAATTSHFEALYNTARPQGVVSWLRFQHASDPVFVVAGVIGALLGFLATFARGRVPRSRELPNEPR